MTREMVKKIALNVMLCALIAPFLVFLGAWLHSLVALFLYGWRLL